MNAWLAKHTTLRSILFVAMLYLPMSSPAAALDSDSISVINQFNATCVRHLAKQDQVREWADSRYRVLRDPATLAKVGGKISGGAA